MTATIPAPHQVATDAREAGASVTDALHAIAYASAAGTLHTEHGGSWDTAIDKETGLVMSAAGFTVALNWGNDYDLSDGFTYEQLAPAQQEELLGDVVAYLHMSLS